MRFQYSDRITEEVALSGMNHTNQRYRWDADRGTTNEATSVGDVLSPDPKHGAKRVAGLQKIIYERKNPSIIYRREN